MKIAVISTTWYPLSHTDVIVTRWVKPFATDAARGWSRPRSRIASLYLEQITERDMGRAFCARESIPVFDSVESALTLGEDELGVDAVMLIGEHGDYPRNEFGQKLYPRKALFDAIVAVFRKVGRAVPIFNDKHLSWDFGHSCEMLAVARELNFPLYAGSSLTHCLPVPAAPLSDGEEIRDALGLFQGDPDNYGFHTMEYLQSFLECRRGGESGVEAVRAFNGESLRAAISAGEIPGELLRAALLRHGYPDTEDLISFILDRVEGSLAYQLRHRDGVRVTHLLLPRFVSGWVAACRNAHGEIRACYPGEGNAQDFFGNFASLNRAVEEFFRTGVPPTPLLRTHLVTGTLEAAQRARTLTPGQWCETPHLGVAY